jgi:hypothetical protein
VLEIANREIGVPKLQTVRFVPMDAMVEIHHSLLDFHRNSRKVGLKKARWFHVYQCK